MKYKYVIVDIDGTIADCQHRVHLLNEKKWDEFYLACDKDKPIDRIIALLKILNEYYHVIFLTGRSDICKKHTFSWLCAHVGSIIDNSYLLMRSHGDHRHDTEVKPELLQQAGFKKEDIAFVLEDRNSMVKKWRELGYTCLQVADGDF